MAPGPNNWIVEVDGKRFGPYTFEDVKTLLENSQIKLTDRVNTTELEGKWMTVQELLQGAAAKNNTREDDGEVDPAVSLFDALQMAKQRAAQKRQENNLHLAEEFVVTSKPHPTTQLWFKVIGGLLFAILVVEVVKLFPNKGPAEIAQNSVADANRTIIPAVKEATPATKTIAAVSAPLSDKEKKEREEKEKREKAEREKKAKEEREAKDREARENREREEREREDREREEREREESERGRMGRDGDFDEEAPGTEPKPGAPRAEEAAPGALKRPKENFGEGAVPAPDGSQPSD